MVTERFEVQRTIEAGPAAIFRLLGDPRGHVAIDSSGMLMSATGDPVEAVGDTFVVHMDREGLNDYPMGRYDVTVVVTDLDPDRQIAGTVHGQIRPAGHPGDPRQDRARRWGPPGLSGGARHPNSLHGMAQERPRSGRYPWREGRAGG